MKKRLCALLAALALIVPALTGCGDQEGRVPINIYRVVAPYFRTDGELISPETIMAQPGVEPVNAAISAFNAQSADARLRSPLPYGAAVISWELRGRVLYLDVNDAYAELTGLELTLANCCCALTFGALEGVDKVAVRHEDVLLLTPLAPEGVLTGDVTTEGD